ncbi:MAG: GDSL-type esterase/lipase family protein [Solidesulfovibrio sp. DCME]|uniref:GDSL-type esterase/lipase family protein n=1 Tax=Solidesulfovibrio sp. DCME TaxID=3447380 RepID=UPI003D13FF72
MKKLLPWLLFLSVFCLALGAAEIVLRLVDYTPPGMLVPRFQTDTPGDLEPNLRARDAVNAALSYTLSSDGRGFRDSKAQAAPGRAEPIRILCLGDSYTFGYGVDDPYTYPAQLQAMLATARPDLAFDVMNAGYPRYGIDDEASFFERKGKACRPDLVILQFFLNDIQDMVRRQPFGLFLLGQAKPAPRGDLERALCRTELYRFAQKLHIAWAGAHPAYASAQEREVLLSGGPYRASLSEAQQRLVATYEGIVSDDSLSVLAPLWQEYIDKALALRAKVEQAGGRFLFLIVPDANQLDNARTAASRALVAPLVARGVDVLDLTFAFMARRFDQGEPLYLHDDPHCSPAGNAFIARRLADGLTFDGNRPRWTGGRLPVRDFAGLRTAGLRFDPRANAPVPVGDPHAILGERLRDNLALTPDGALGLTALAQVDPARPGVLEVRAAPGCPAAVLDLAFRYSLPRPESTVSVFASQDGGPFVPVKHLARLEPVPGDGNETRTAFAAIPLRPTPDLRLALRFVLAAKASLLTETPGENRAAPRPFSLSFYPSLEAAAPLPAVVPTPFPAPEPGDLLSPNTLRPDLALSGLGGIEHDTIGTWRWGFGPQSTVAFTLARDTPLTLEARLTNGIPGQDVIILVNGQEKARLAGLGRQAWLTEGTDVRLPIAAKAGANTITVRYGKWNGHGTEAPPGDASPYAVAFTRFAILGLPVATAGAP